LINGTAAFAGCSGLSTDVVVLLVLNRVGKQVLGVDEPPAGLAKTLRRLLLAEAEHIDAFWRPLRTTRRQS
jgi:hypothetical protein